MKNTMKAFILGVFSVSMLVSASPALAYYPQLSASAQNGSNNIQVSISGANPYRQINLFSRQSSSLWTEIDNIGQTDGSGYFSQVISIPSDNTGSPLQLYVTVSGQQSSTVQVNYNGSNNGCSYYNNCNSGSVTLSQTSLNLTIGQNASVTISGNGGYTLSGGYNSSVATAYISGNAVVVNGYAQGTTTFSVCQNGGSCASLYVTVNNSNNGCTYNCGSISLSQTSVNLNVGQSSTVSAYNYSGGTLYVYNNSNTNAVSASVSGSIVTLYGLNTGTSTVTVCGNSVSQCGTINVIVGGNNNSLSLSQTSVSLNLGQTSIVYNNNGGSVYVQSNSNSNVASATVNGSQVSVVALMIGSTTLNVCAYNGGQCASVYVTVNGNGGNNGSISFSQNNVNLNYGQNILINMYSSSNNYGSYYVQSNSNSGVVTVSSITNSSLSLTGANTGSSTVVVCQNGTSQCGSLYITVGGYNSSNNNGNLTFQTTNVPTFYSGQYYNYQLQAYGGSSPYTYTLVSGSLPSGVYLNPNGQLYGTPQYVYNASSFMIRVNDTYGRSTTANFYTNSATNTGGGLLYPSGSVAGVSAYANGTLISENGTVSIVYRNLKSSFANASAFTGFGFKFSNVRNVVNSGINSTGYVIKTSSTSHPWGSWIKSGQTIYVVHENGLIPVSDYGTFVSNGGQDSLVVPANAWDFRLAMLSPMVWNDIRLR